MWSLKTQENGLKVLRILARESGDTPLTRDESLGKVLKLADVAEPESKFKNLQSLSQDEINGKKKYCYLKLLSLSLL